MISATMPRKRGPGRPRKHGGARPGAGRPRTDGVGTQRLIVFLTPDQVAKVERWQEANGADSFSEALRQIVDAVAKVDRSST